MCHEHDALHPKHPSIFAMRVTTKLLNFWAETSNDICKKRQSSSRGTEWCRGRFQASDENIGIHTVAAESECCFKVQIACQKYVSWTEQNTRKRFFENYYGVLWIADGHSLCTVTLQRADNTEFMSMPEWGKKSTSERTCRVSNGECRQ